MKSELMPIVAACAAFALLAPARGAVAEKSESKSDSKSESKSRSEIRVLSGPSRGVIVQRGEKGEKETVAFLGVETGPVSPTTGAQLGLPRGTGLVVNHVVPKSPADGVLQPHDILLKLDDQILIETRQLAVLVRNKKQGEEVSLTYLRGGQKATAKVALGQHEVPKLSLLGGDGAVFGFEAAPFSAFTPGAQWFEAPAANHSATREETDRTLSLIERARSPRTAAGPQGPVRIQIDRQGGPGFRAIAINTENSNVVLSDGEGTLELSHKDGVKSLVAKDSAGAEFFSGPVTTPEERKALPPELRARLEKLESMHGVTFRTDGDFKGAESRVVRPLERKISLPRPAPAAPRNPLL